MKIKPNPYNNLGQRRCCGWLSKNLEAHWVNPPFDKKFTKRNKPWKFEDGLHEMCKTCKQQWNGKTGNPSKLTLKQKNELPINYVYQHIDINGLIMYIGIGRDGRAWDFTMRRQPDHSSWLLSELLNHRLNTDVSKLLHNNITRNEASVIENELIHKYKPRFNMSKKE